MKTPLASLADENSGLNGRHVLMIFLAFFGIVLAVNCYFMFAALSTYSGVVSVEPYRKGLAYNSRIAADERQTQLGWKETLAVSREGKITLQLNDKYDMPVQGLLIGATVGRPTTSQFDKTPKLREEPAGTYSGDVGALTDGTWLVTVEARDGSGADPVFRSRKRLWLKQ